MSFLDNLPKPFLALAPMDDVTDTVFRQIVADLAPPDLFFTEFVNVDGLQSPGRAKLLKKLQFTSKEMPIVAQLWGINPENFYKTTKELLDGTLIAEANALQGKDEKQSKLYEGYSERASESLTQQSVASTSRTAGSAGRQASALRGKRMCFDGVDLNMGCPIKTVIKNGACAALINNRELAGEIIDAVREGARRDFPVSVKTRVGFTTLDTGWLEFLLSKKLDLLSIHGRTAKQQSSVPADWDLIGQVREMRDAMFPALVPQPLRLDEAQGTDEQRTEAYMKYGEGAAQSTTPRFAKSVSGAVGSAGRQADAAHGLRTLIVGNGDVVSRAQALELAKAYKLDGIMIGRGIFHDPFTFAQKSPWTGWSKQQKIELFCKHINLFAKTWSKGEYKFESLKKFAKVYVNNFEGASELRGELMQAQSPEEALALLTSK